MSVEVWKTFFDWATVVLLFLTFGAGLGVLVTGNIIDKQQKAKLKQFDSDLTQAKTELAKQQERAAKAEASIALASQYAAEADAKAEGFRLDIAMANQAAAEANRIAESEKLARLQLEARLADRVLSPAAKSDLRETAKKFPAGIRIDVCTIGDSLEVANIATSIVSALSEGGWNVRQWRVMGGAAARGILVGTKEGSDNTITSAASAIISSIGRTGTWAGPWNFDELVKAANSGIRNGPPQPLDAPILVVIGSKQ